MYLVQRHYSGIGDKVEHADLEFMLYKVLFIERFEVSGHGFGDHWDHLLSLYSWLLCQLKALVCLLVGGLTLESKGLVVIHVDYTRLAALPYSLEHFIVLPQFSLLDLIEALLVAGVALKRQGVEGVLGVFFVINVVDAVSPVGERLLVAGLTEDWLALVFVLPYLLKFRLYFKLFVGRLSSGS